MDFKTEQEEFWAGEFGDKYISRNSSDDFLASNLNFFTRALKGATDISNCIEFGANIGMNLKAIKLLFPNLEISALEINKEAIKSLEITLPRKSIFEKSIIDFSSRNKWDLVLIKGVLIHINPNFLEAAYKNLYHASKKYILICEYYSRSPTALEYRGYKNKLFKRDFAGEILDLYKDLKLIDYGFVYHRDRNFPQDDLSWFLLEK